MTVAGIFHTGITVSDLDRSIAFYRDCLGLELVTQWESSQPYLRRVVGFPDAELRIALLRVPATPAAVSGHHIELLEYRVPRGERGDPRTCNPGNAHVAFVVDDLDRRARRGHARPQRGRQGRVPAGPRRRHAGVHPARPGGLDRNQQLTGPPIRG